MTSNGKPNKWLVALSVFSGAIMSTTDTFILYIATPHLRGTFSATVPEISWISTSYAVSALVCMLLTGWMCDHFGRKTTYQTGLIIFIVSSIVCALSTSLAFLIIARIAQGIGAGIVVPTENIILRRTFPPNEHSIVLSIYGTTIMLGPAIGPWIGGVIIDSYHWSLMFLVNIPVGIIGLLMVNEFVAYDTPVKKLNTYRFDWVGLAFLMVGLFCLIWLFERGNRLYWFSDRLNLVLLVISSSALSMFCAQEFEFNKPAVNLRVLGNSVFRITTFLNFVFGFVVTATLFVLPLYMQDVLGFSATAAGKALIPRALFMMVFFPLIGMLFNRLNSMLLIIVGLIIGLYSGICMSRFTHETGWHDMVIPQIYQGIAVVLVLVPLTTIGIRAVRPEEMPAAAGIDSMSRQLGGILGIAIFASLVTHYEQSAWGVLRENVSFSYTVFFKRFDEVVEYFLQLGSSRPTALDQATYLLNMRVQEQALVVTYMNIFQIVALIFAFMIVCSFFVRLKN